MKTSTYKNRFIDELNEQIWRKTLNCEFDATKIPAVKKLQDDKFKELDQLKANQEAIDPKDTTKVTRTSRKKLDLDIAKAQEFIVSCDETISMINESIRKDKEKIKGLKERVAFAEKYKYSNDDN